MPAGQDAVGDATFPFIYCCCCAAAAGRPPGTLAGEVGSYGVQRGQRAAVTGSRPRGRSTVRPFLASGPLDWAPQTEGVGGGKRLRTVGHAGLSARSGVSNVETRSRGNGDIQPYAFDSDAPPGCVRQKQSVPVRTCPRPGGRSRRDAPWGYQTSDFCCGGFPAGPQCGIDRLRFDRASFYPIRRLKSDLLSSDNSGRSTLADVDGRPGREFHCGRPHNPGGLICRGLVCSNCGALAGLLYSRITSLVCWQLSARRAGRVGRFSFFSKLRSHAHRRLLEPPRLSRPRRRAAYATGPGRPVLVLYGESKPDSRFRPQRNRVGTPA